MSPCALSVSEFPLAQITLFCTKMSPALFPVDAVAITMFVVAAGSIKNLLRYLMLLNAYSGASPVALM